MKLLSRFVEKVRGKNVVLFFLAVVLALGAPLGWAVVKGLWGIKAPSSYEIPLFIYITFGTITAFFVFAAIMVFLLEKEANLAEELLKAQIELEKEQERTCKELQLVKSSVLKISQFGARIGKSKSEEEVYYNLAYAAHVALGFDRVLVVVNRNGMLSIAEARGIKVESEEERRVLESLKLPCSEEGGSLGLVCRDKRPMIFGLKDFIPPKYKLRPPLSDVEALRSRAFIVVPVCVEGDKSAIAVIAADRKHSGGDVSNDDLVTLEILCDVAGTTLARLRLEKQLQHLATIDGLTGLFNRRFWMERAEEELQRAKRYGYPVSFIMLDIDDFKEVNDTWGHQAGDKVLKGVAEIIRRGIRGVDIAGRYGGEEFVVMLPHTSGEDAYTVAERLRRTLEGTKVGVPKVITATFGVSWYNPEEGDVSLDELLLRADRALYRGKAQGKNRVVKSW